MLKQILFICSVFLFLSSLYAEEVEFVEGMEHLDFAKLLLKKADLESFLPASPGEDDYFNVLQGLGIEPPDGWDKEKAIKREDVVFMVGLSEEEAKGINFAELCQQLVSLLKEITLLNSDTEEPYYSPEEE
ncbi:MAG: hypothetical protein AB7E08_00780 [Candidatus Omnitrophota bacterium]